MRRSEQTGGLFFWGEDCPLNRKLFNQNHLTERTLLRADEEARLACDYYKRNAIGPINVSRNNGNANSFQYTYACAIR